MSQIEEETIQEEGTELDTSLSPDTNSEPESAGSLQGVSVPRNPDGTIKKGYSLNPKGREKGSSNYATKLNKILAEIDKTATPEFDANGNPITPDNLEIALRKLVELAKAGDMTAIKELGDRVEGKAKQSIALRSSHNVRYDPAEFEELEDLWFSDYEDDEEEEQPEQTEAEKNAQALVDAPVTPMSEPEAIEAVVETPTVVTPEQSL